MHVLTGTSRGYLAGAKRSFFGSANKRVKSIIVQKWRENNLNSRWREKVNGLTISKRLMSKSANFLKSSETLPLRNGILALYHGHSVAVPALL